METKVRPYRYKAAINKAEALAYLAPGTRLPGRLSGRVPDPVTVSDSWTHPSLYGEDRRRGDAAISQRSPLACPSDGSHNARSGWAFDRREDGRPTHDHIGYKGIE